MNYAPQLDGLRAIAILAVLVYHTAPGILPGGFTGVDIFFVLSGYLISRVILYHIREDNFSLQEFYLRRIQRLLPNAIIMIFATIAISLVILLPSSAVKVSANAFWALFNISNFYIWKSLGSYWGETAASTPLLHTWSLAIEEQFYLVFPVILLMLTRHRLRPNIFVVMVSLSLASIALCIYGSWSHPSATFYLLPTRAWELLFGTLFASYQVSATADRPVLQLRRSISTELAGWFGMGLVLAGFVLISEKDPFPGVVALVPTIGTLAVIISIVDGNTSLAWLLARSSMVAIGKLSYSIYLWHWPLLIIGANLAELTGQSRRAGSILGAAFGMALAMIAYKFVEKPLRSRGPGRRRRLFIIASGFSGILVISLVVSLYRPVADPHGLFDPVIFTGLNYDVVYEKAVTNELDRATRFGDVLFPPAPAKPHEVWRNGGIVHHWGKGNPRIVVLGSSHALMYGRLIDDVCRQLDLSVAFLSANATPVFFAATINNHFLNRSLAQSFDESRRKWLNEWRPDGVIVIDAWGNYISDNTDFERRFRELVSELSSFTKHIIVMTQVPVMRVGESINAREFVNWHSNMKGVLPRIAPDSNEPLRRSSIAIMEAAALEFKKLCVLRVDQHFYAEDGTVRYACGRSFLYADDDHLSDAGAELAREIIKSAIQKATKQQ